MTAMAFVLNALIADLELLRGASGLVVVALPGGRGLAPLPDELWRASGLHSRPLLRGAEGRLAPDDEFDGPDERRRLIDDAAAAFAWIADRCARLSATPGAAVAYVEAEYFGGGGSQAAAVWEAGERVLGPVLEEAAIDLALARIGVARAGAGDEFTALALGRCRSTRDWLELAEAPLVSR